MGVRIMYMTSDGEAFEDRGAAMAHERRIGRDDGMDWLERRVKYVMERIRQKDKWLKSFDHQVRFTLGELKETDESSYQMIAELAARLRGEAVDARRMEEEKQHDLLVNLPKDHTRLMEDNRDVDGTCRMRLVDGAPCGQPTVEGTRWCEKHVDEWCDRHGEHCDHAKRMGGKTFLLKCAECAGGKED